MLQNKYYICITIKRNNIMTTSQINTEIKNTTDIKNTLHQLVVVEKNMKYYQDYINTCTYLYQLLRVKPNHILTIA